MAKTATTIRNNNQAMTQTVCTHERRSSKASDPRNKTQNAIPGNPSSAPFWPFHAAASASPLLQLAAGRELWRKHTATDNSRIICPFRVQARPTAGALSAARSTCVTRGQFPKVICQNDEYRKRQQRITELSKPLKDADLSSAA